MSKIISATLNNKLSRALIIRILLISTAAAILYFGLLTIYSVPQNTIVVKWDATGRAIVIKATSAKVVTGSADITGVLPEDWLMAINGVPLTPSDLYFRFGIFSQSHLYILQRGDVDFSARIEQAPLSFPGRIYLWLPLLVALETWALGALILFFTPKDNKLARLLGMVALGMALFLIADRSAAVGIPGSRLTFGVLAPIVSVGYLELALSQDGSSTKGRTLVSILYLLASLMATLTVVEVLYLSPTSALGQSIRKGLVLVNYGAIGLSQLGVPILIFVRARLATSPTIKRQLTILALGTGLAVAPAVFLDLLPVSLGFRSFVADFPDLLLPLGSLVPATFAYVILRYRYLGLDMFVVRGATVILGLLLTLVFYSVITSLVPSTPQTATLAAPLAALFTVGTVFSASWRLRLGVETIIFGSSQHLEKVYQDLTSQLASNPQMNTLTSVLLDQTTANVQVRQAALLLFNRQRKLECVRALRVEDIDPDPIAARGPAHLLLRQVAPDDRVWQAVDWAYAIVPIQNNVEVLGYAVYGEKVDGPFDVRERDLLINMATASVAALENVRLIETLREMSRRLLSNSATERMVMASRLHNEPLQRTAAIALSLEQLLDSAPPESPLAQTVTRQIGELRQLKAEIREICSGLRPRVLDQGLPLMLSGVIQTFSEDTPQIRVNFQASIEGVNLSPQAMEAVYHVAIEALNNVRKHSEADQVDITAGCRPGRFQLQIADNGRGLGMVNIDLNSLVKGKHLGLAFLYEWAEIVGGRLEICAGATGGAVIRLTLPLDNDSFSPAPMEFAELSAS